MAYSQDAPLDLRLRNEQLEARVSDLESTLDAARKRIFELEATIRSMEKSTSTVNPISTAKKSPEVSKEKSNDTPYRSPFAIKTAIQNEYTAAFNSSKLSKPGTSKWTKDDSAYRKWLQVWIAATDRLHQKRIDWTVILQRTDRLSPTESIVTLAPWDSDRQEVAGDSFQSQIPTRILDRIRRVMENKEKNIPLQLKGVYFPHLQLNPKRMDPGPFNNPPFIGFMVELQWSVDIKSLSPAMTSEEDIVPRKGATKDGS
jgi:hypothetical protein